MSNQVLTIDQCNELLALGLDMSDASMLEDRVGYIALNGDIKKKFIDNGEYHYTYTLQDILEKLPPLIDYSEEKGYHLDIDFGSKEISYYTYLYDDYLVSFDYDNLLDGAFELLKWCIENKYINKE